jgi:hypothetical protein
MRLLKREQSTMKTIAIFALLAASALGQTPGTTTTTTALTLTGPASVTAGQPVTLTLSISGTASTLLAGLQWSLAVPPGITSGSPSVALSGPDSALGLGVFCGTSICLETGFNGTVVVDNPLVDGALAVFLANVPASVAPGNYAFALSGLVGASTVGAAVPLVSGSVYSLQVLSRCDLNGDGSVNVTDIQMALNQALGIQACSFSGGCGIVSLQAVIIAASGGKCVL